MSQIGILSMFCLFIHTQGIQTYVVYRHDNNIIIWIIFMKLKFVVKLTTKIWMYNV